MTSDNNNNDVQMKSNALKILQRIINKNEDKDLDRLASIIARELKENADVIKTEDRNLLRLLANSASMRLTPESNNEPFKVSTIWPDGRRSALPSDFSSDDFNILSEVVDNIDYLPLKARVFDLLWVSGQPNKHVHARNAVNCYLTEDIDCKKISEIGIKELERAYRLSKQINSKGQVTAIEQYLYKALYSEPDNIIYSIADLIKRTGSNLRRRTDALKSKGIDIASKLESLGSQFKKAGNFNNAAIHFKLSSEYYEETSKDKYIFTLVQAADCYIKEADKHFDLDQELDLLSSDLFQTAIDLYRKVPEKCQDEYLINTKIADAYCKHRESNRRLLKHMKPLYIRSENLDNIKIGAKKFVSHKKTTWEGLLSFSQILAIPSYQSLKKSEIAKINQASVDHLYRKFDLEQDGRTIAETPAVESTEGQASIDNIVETDLIRGFNCEIGYRVKLYILPALEQVLSEHAISKDSISNICNQSPLVPKHNINLISHAIWLGFERDFSTAIHLVAPQMELIVRTQLNNNDVDTVLKDNGIEQEKGLSSLLNTEGINEVFNEDEIFELKAVFANSSGPNLRNKVAHGLMNDSSASSSAPVYAWWMLFRMVIHSITVPAQKLNYK